MHPHKDVAASGQAGKKAIVCIFDASRHAEPVKRGASASSTAGGAGQPPLVLRELSLGKKETRGVRGGSKHPKHCSQSPFIYVSPHGGLD